MCLVFVLIVGYTAFSIPYLLVLKVKQTLSSIIYGVKSKIINYRLILSEDFINFLLFNRFITFTGVISVVKLLICINFS